VNLGMVLGKHGRDDEAFNVLDEAERITPSYSMIYVYRGHIFQERGNLAAAIDQYERAVKFDPANEVARDSLAQARQRQSAPSR
jgi:Tfp pilus assembly protein PilF